MTIIERSITRTGTSRPHHRRRLARWLAGPAWVILVLLCVDIVVVVSRYLTFNPDVYFPEQRQVYLRVELFLGVHVLSGILALVVGPFQFVGWIRRRSVRVH